MNAAHLLRHLIEKTASPDASNVLLVLEGEGAVEQGVVLAYHDKPAREGGARKGEVVVVDI